MMGVRVVSIHYSEDTGSLTVTGRYRSDRVDADGFAVGPGTYQRTVQSIIAGQPASVIVAAIVASLNGDA